MSDSQKEGSSDYDGQSRAERGDAGGSTCFHPVNSASDLDRSPGRITSVVAFATKQMRETLKLVEEISNSYGPWKTKSKTLRKFQRSSESLFRLLYERLKNSTPEKEKFSAIIISQDSHHFYHHEHILSKTGNWDVKWAQNGENTFPDSYHPSEFSFDLIIIHHDLAGLDGPAMTRLCRDLSLPSLIVGVSASEEGSAEREAFIRSGLDYCLKKPSYGEEEMLTECKYYYKVKEELNKLGNVVKNIERAFEINE